MKYKPNFSTITHGYSKYLIIYAVLAAAWVQFILLPILKPSWHGGNGLLIGTDSITYHQQALEMANLIRAHGWSFWKLSIQYFPGIGILAGAYTLLAPHPWVMIPFLASFHVGSTLLLAKTYILLGVDENASKWGALPFFLFPSSLLFYSQLLRDEFSIFGFFALLYGTLFLFRKCLSKKVKFTEVIQGLGICIGGTAMISVVRPLHVQILVNLFTGLLIVPFTLMIVAAIKKRKSALVLYSKIFGLLLILLFFMRPLGMPGTEEITGPTDPNGLAAVSRSGSPALETIWHPSPCLPHAIDQRFKYIAARRDGFVQRQDSSSNIDNEIRFNNIQDVMRYIPRALEIAFLQPFPNWWGSHGNRPESGPTRKIASLEMILVYIGLLLLALRLPKMARIPEFWLTAYFCAALLLLGGLTVNNLGTLYRQRYPFLMFFVGLGFAIFYPARSRQNEKI